MTPMSFTFVGVTLRAEQEPCALYLTLLLTYGAFRGIGVSRS